METNKLKVCDTCPWLLKNQGKRHKAGWFTVKNLRRLWAGLRSGNATGMVCHASDPNNKDYGGDANIKPGHEAQCGGSVVLLIKNLNALEAKEPQPITPPLTRGGIAVCLNKILFGGGASVDTGKHSIDDFGVPWQKTKK
jgi:hypothetical protein